MIAAIVGAGTDEWDLLLCDDGLQRVDRQRGPAAAVAEVERIHRPRWVWADTSRDYPPLLRAGVSVERCHDLMLAERTLLAREDRYGEPADVAAILARGRGEEPVAPRSVSAAVAEPALFGAGEDSSDAGPTVDDILSCYRDQTVRLGADSSSPPGELIDVDPGALRMLFAADSASALVAAEMSAVGMPFDAAVHDQTLRGLLGDRASAAVRPATLARLAEEIAAAFGHPVNPDSTTDLRDAFRRAGFAVDSTRSSVLRGLDHPAVAPTLQYKDLHRLHTANGWSWLDQWVRGGRLHAEYVAAAVISGRWATRGGGALQIPRAARAAVRARAGHRLVVADAAQLEPRVLIALTGDGKLAEMAGADDLYSALAGVGFSGDRSQAKAAMIGAMYGATAGEAGALLSTLRRHFPAAMSFLETAAARGERGRLVGSVLGRASHRPGADWQRVVAEGSGADATAAQERRARQAARSWGRFTRNFVIQASAADWAAVWLSTLRRELRREVPDAELVLFQHDELIVHVRTQDAERVAVFITAAAAVADRMVFPRAPGGWRVPVRPVSVECYADAK